MDTCKFCIPEGYPLAQLITCLQILLCKADSDGQLIPKVLICAWPDQSDSKMHTCSYYSFDTTVSERWIGYTLVSKTVWDFLSVDNNTMPSGLRPSCIMLSTSGKSHTILQSLKLQSDIGHFLTIYCTCLSKNRFIPSLHLSIARSPSCENNERVCTVGAKTTPHSISVLHVCCYGFTFVI